SSILTFFVAAMSSDQSAASTAVGFPPTGTFLSPADYVRLTGFSLSTVRRYLASGRLPKIQPGGSRCRISIPPQPLSPLRPVPLAEDKAETPATTVGDGGPSTSSKPETSPPRKRGPTPRWKGRR